MQSNGRINGHTIMNLQFVNETDNVISDSLGNDYGDFNLKRDLDSDSDSGGSKRMGINSASGDGPVQLKPGKKTKGRVKIKMEFIENKLRRYTTFSKRKTGIMKKAYELSTLTGTQVMLLVASETGHVYTFATKKLQPMITSESGKALIQTCLNSPDGMMVSPTHTCSSDQRMNPTGFEETELNYGLSDDDREESPSKSDDSRHGLPYMAAPSPQSASSVAATSSTTSFILPSQNILAALPSNQQIQLSTHPQPPPAHMGIQSSQTFAQPPHAHMGSANSLNSTTGTVSTQSLLSTVVNPTVTTTTKPALTMQLPSGGFTLLPNALTPGTQFAISAAGGQQQQPQFQQQQTSQQLTQPAQPAQMYRLPSGQIITIPGLNQIPVSVHTTTTSPSASSNTRPPQLQQPVAVVSGTNSSTGTQLLYQTQQGLVYASPSGLPEGYIINLPASQLNVQDQQGGGNSQPYIAIPVPVSLSASSAPVRR